VQTVNPEYAITPTRHMTSDTPSKNKVQKHKTPVSHNASKSNLVDTPTNRKQSKAPRVNPKYADTPTKQMTSDTPSKNKVQKQKTPDSHKVNVMHTGYNCNQTPEMDKKNISKSSPSAIKVMGPFEKSPKSPRTPGSNRGTPKGSPKQFPFTKEQKIEILRAYKENECLHNDGPSFSHCRNRDRYSHLASFYFTNDGFQCTGNQYFNAINGFRRTFANMLQCDTSGAPSNYTDNLEQAIYNTFKDLADGMPSRVRLSSKTVSYLILCIEFLLLLLLLAVSGSLRLP